MRTKLSPTAVIVDVYSKGVKKNTLEFPSMAQAKEWVAALTHCTARFPEVEAAEEARIQKMISNIWGC